jgi:hypothetical protein
MSGTKVPKKPSFDQMAYDGTSVTTNGSIDEARRIVNIKFFPFALILAKPYPTNVEDITVNNDTQTTIIIVFEKSLKIFQLLNINLYEEKSNLSGKTGGNKYIASESDWNDCITIHNRGKAKINPSITAVIKHIIAAACFLTFFFEIIIIRRLQQKTPFSLNI